MEPECQTKPGRERRLRGKAGYPKGKVRENGVWQGKLDAFWQ